MRTNQKKEIEKILLVEDEYMVRELVSTALKKVGYHVIEASNGDEAKEKMKTFGDSIDLVLTDIVMPGLTGKQLVDELSKIQANFKSLYMSGYPNDIIVQKDTLDKDAQFIQKPFSPVSLINKVKDILNG